MFWKRERYGDELMEPNKLFIVLVLAVLILAMPFDARMYTGDPSVGWRRNLEILLVLVFIIGAGAGWLRSVHRRKLGAEGGERKKGHKYLKILDRRRE